MYGKINIQIPIFPVPWEPWKILWAEDIDE